MFADYPELYNEIIRTSRKEYKCKCCGFKIPIKHKYIDITGRWNGEFDNFRIHIECNNIVKNIQNIEMEEGNNDGVAFEDMKEWLDEYYLDKNWNKNLRYKWAEVLFKYRRI